MSKTQLADPPDFRLAKAFQFTAEDLYANREGILSWRQRGFSDRLLYRLIYIMRALPFIGRLWRNAESPKKQVRLVASLCGRIQLDHHIVDKRLSRSTLFYEYYQLVFPGHDRRFAISRDQFNVLSDNLRYRVYYQGISDTSHILSIERMIGSCDGQTRAPSR